MKVNLFEYLDLKKDVQNNRLIVFSDWNTVKETSWNKHDLRKAGFQFDPKIKSWTMPIDQMEKAVQGLNDINTSIQGKVKNDKLKENKKTIVAGLEHFKDWMENQDVPASKSTEIKSKIDSYISDLANATDEAALSAEISRFLEFSSKFHNYSFGNRLLIYLQKRNAGKVAGAKQWEKKFSRRLIRGATPIWIWCASKTGAKRYEPKKDENEDETGELDKLISNMGRYSGVKFTPCRVFDISDTEPIDASGEIPETPEWFGENTPNQTADMLVTILEGILSNESIKLTRDKAQGGERGYSAGGHINLSAGVEGEGALSTLTHEFGHELMHKPNAMFYIDNSGDGDVRELKELQAESVSYIVLKHYGIPVKHHPTYLALWKGNGELIKKNSQVIAKTSKYIINSIDREGEKYFNNKEEV